MGLISAGCAKTRLAAASPFRLAAMIGWCWLARLFMPVISVGPEAFGSSSTTKTFQSLRQLAARRFNTLLSPKKAGGKNGANRVGLSSYQSQGVFAVILLFPSQKPSIKRVTKAENQDPSSLKQRLPESPGRDRDRGGATGGKKRVSSSHWSLSGWQPACWPRPKRRACAPWSCRRGHHRQLGGCEGNVSGGSLPRCR